MPNRNWKAFESPNKEFDEFGDDDSNDLDKNFKPADPKPEANAKEKMSVCPFCKGDGCKVCDQSGFVPQDEYDEMEKLSFLESHKQDEIVDKNPMYSYDGKKREGVYDANKDRKGSNEAKTFQVAIGNSNPFHIESGDSRVVNTFDNYEEATAHAEKIEGGHVVIVDEEAKETVYKSQSGLINGTETYETVDVDFSESDSAVEFTCNCGVRVTEESLPKHMEEAHGKITEARYKTYKTQHNIGINESDANVNDIHLGKKTRSGESLAKEDFGFGLHPSTNGQDNFDSAFGVSSPEEEQQMEDQIDDAMNPIESEYFDIKSEYWESFIDDPVKFDEFINRVQSLRSEAEQAVATIPRRKTGFYTRRNFDEVEWLNSVIDDMNGIIRQAEPMRNNSLFESFPSGNIGESLLRAKEEAFPLMDFQSIDAKIEELERALEDPTLDNSQRDELEQRLIKVTQARTDLESGAYTPDLMGSAVNPSLGIFEAKKVWKSYEMQDEYAYEEDEDDVKVSLNIQDGTLTDKPVEQTDEHHTVSDSESTSPDDEGFSVGNIASGNYEKVIGYNPEPNHELGDHKLKSKKGERNSQDNPASETQTFYSNIIGKLSGLESDE